MANLFEKLNFAVAPEKVPLKEKEKPKSEVLGKSLASSSPAVDIDSVRVRANEAQQPGTRRPACALDWSHIAAPLLTNGPRGPLQPPTQDGCSEVSEGNNHCQQVTAITNAHSPLVLASRTKEPSLLVSQEAKFALSEKPQSSSKTEEPCVGMQEIQTTPSTTSETSRGVSKEGDVSPRPVSTTTEQKRTLSEEKTQSIGQKDVPTDNKHDKALASVSDNTVEHKPVTQKQPEPVTEKKNLTKRTKHKDEHSPVTSATLSCKKPKKLKKSSEGEKTSLKGETDRKQHHEKKSEKILKPAKRERNSSSADARAAYLPLSKPFVIPRKKAKQDLFQEVSLQSREFLKDILPIITKQYRSKDAATRFTFTKAQLIHNEELTKGFLERRKEMRDEGRTDKELTESYAFISTESKIVAERMCQEGITAPGGHVAALGNPNMGVYLSRHSDIIKRDGLESGHQGMLIILKILKGKVKAIPLNYSNVLDPMPNYDSHVAKSNAVDMARLTSLQTPTAFDKTQIYLYEFGDLDMAKRPRQVCPYAMVHFTYQEPVKPSPTLPPPSPHLPASSPQETRDPVVQSSPLVHHHSTPPPTLPASTPANSDAPLADPHGMAGPEAVDKPQAALSSSEIEDLRKKSFTVWEGTLSAKAEPLCSAKMVSYTSPVLPQTLPAVINFRTKISFAKMHAHFPSGIFASGIPLTSGIREVCRRNKFVVYCELQRNEESSMRYGQLMEFMMLNQVVLKCRLEGGVTMFVLPTSTLSHQLGLTRGDYPDTLHVLFTSRTPMVGHIIEKGIHIPHGTKQEQPIVDNQLLEQIDNKQQMLRIGLLSMFTRQSHDLKCLTGVHHTPEAKTSSREPSTKDQDVSDTRTPPSVDETSAISTKNKVIDYQHGLAQRKDLSLTYKSYQREAGEHQYPLRPAQPTVPNRSPLPSEVLNVHPMYNSPASSLDLHADAIPEASLHPMYNTSGTSLVTAAASDGTPKSPPHPMYEPQPQTGTDSIKDMGHEENVHPMYSQHIERSKPDQKSPRSLPTRDPRVASALPPGPYGIPEIQREPPKVLRQSSELHLGSILDQQQEIKTLQEETRILRKLKETSKGDTGLEELHSAKLTQLQEILSTLQKERSRLNQQQHRNEKEDARVPLGRAKEGQRLGQPWESRKVIDHGPEQDETFVQRIEAKYVKPCSNQMKDNSGESLLDPSYFGLQREMQVDKEMHQHGLQQVLEKSDVLSTADVKSGDSFAKSPSIKSPSFSETTKDTPGSSVTPPLSTNVLEVVQKIAKMPVKPAQSNTEVSKETLEAVIKKVLSHPAKDKTAEEGNAGSIPSFPVSIPLDMLSLNKSDDNKSAAVDHGAVSSFKESSEDICEEVSQNVDVGSGNKLPKEGHAKPSLNPFGDALASMDQYSLSGRAAKKLKRSHSKESDTPSALSGQKETSTQEGKQDTDGKLITEDKHVDNGIPDKKPLRFVERFNKDSLSLDIDLTKKVLPNLECSTDDLSSPIKGASEMKAFLNGGVSHGKDRIISATEMKSYLNKKLHETEHEKVNKGRKGASSVRRGKGPVSSRERTIAEIDNEIRRLNKEKERLKSEYARKRNRSGENSSSDKPQKLPFIRSVDFSGLGRIPKKKTPSPETVQRESVHSDPSISNTGGSADLNSQSQTGTESKEGVGGTMDQLASTFAALDSVTGVPDCSGDKPSYQVCPREVQLPGDPEKGLLVSGEDSSGRTLYTVVLTKKFLQGGMKEQDWSGSSLWHCVNDVLHRGARCEDTQETEKERQFSQNATAATKKVLARQLAGDKSARQVCADSHQTVTYMSESDAKSSKLFKSIPESKEASGSLMGQEVEGDVAKDQAEPREETNNNLTAPKETTTTPVQEEPSRGKLASPIKEPTAIGGTVNSQEAQTGVLGSPSTHLTDVTSSVGHPERYKDTTGRTSAPEEAKKQVAVDKPAIKEGLVINDGACFFGDLESDEGVCVNFEQDEGLTDGKSPTEPTPGLAQPAGAVSVSPVQNKNQADHIGPAATKEEDNVGSRETQDRIPIETALNASPTPVETGKTEAPCSKMASCETIPTKHDAAPSTMASSEAVPAQGDRTPSKIVSSKTIPSNDDAEITQTVEKANNKNQAAADARNSGDSGDSKRAEKPVAKEESKSKDTEIKEVSKCDSTTDEQSQNVTSLKSESSLKESRASHRHHPYEPRKKSGEDKEEASRRLSQHLAVPELKKLMQNYTIAAYKDRRKNRHMVDSKSDFYDRPRNTPARFKNVAREFSRGKAERNKEGKQDVKKLASKQQEKRDQLQKLEKELQGAAKSETGISEEAYQVEKCYYEDQVKSGHPEGPKQDRGPKPSCQGQDIQRKASHLQSAVTVTTGAPAGTGVTVTTTETSSTGNNTGLSTSSSNNDCRSSNTYNSSSNGSKCFNSKLQVSASSTCTNNVSSTKCSYNSSFSLTSSGSSSYSNSSSSSITNGSSSGFSSASANRLAGPGGGNADSQINGGGIIQSQHNITSADNQCLSEQQLLSDSPQTSSNQNFFPMRPQSVTPKKESCLLSCSINVARDPRLTRLHQQPPPSSQTDPLMMPQQTTVSPSATNSTNKQTSTSTSDGVAVENNQGASVVNSKLPKLSERPAKSILKGSQRPPSPAAIEKENRSSSPSCDQKSEMASDASKKVKISLSQYKVKADPRPKKALDEIEKPREEAQTKAQSSLELEPSADARQVVFLPSCKNIKVTLTGDSERTLLLEDEQMDKDMPYGAKSNLLETNMDISGDGTNSETSVVGAVLPEDPFITVQISNEKDSRVVFDRTSSSVPSENLAQRDIRNVCKSKPISMGKALSAGQPNLMITIPRDDAQELVPSDTRVVQGASMDTDIEDGKDVALVSGLPDSCEMGLETSATIAQLELEDSIFNIVAEAVENTTRQACLREHLARLSPNSVSRRLQNIKYELDAFWTELRSLYLPDPLQVEGAVPCDPRKPRSLGNGKPTQNGEVTGCDLTAQTANSVLADISSKLNACLGSDRLTKKEQEKMTACFSRHLPKVAKLTSMLFSPQVNGTSPEKHSKKSCQIDEIVSGLKQDFHKRVEDVCLSVMDHSKLEGKLEDKKEPESPALSSRTDLLNKIQQMLKAARARSCKSLIVSGEPGSSAAFGSTSDNPTALKLGTDHIQDNESSQVPSEVDNGRGAEISPSLTEREPEVEPSEAVKQEQLQSTLEIKEEDGTDESLSTPEVKSCSSSSQTTPDSCKWGKLMKLWGKRPTKQGKTMKATWIKTEKPKTSSETSTETTPSCGTPSEDNKEETKVEKDAPVVETKECKDYKLSSSEEKAVEQLCAKLLDEDKAPSGEKKALVTGTIPTLLNRSTSHASSTPKSSHSTISNSKPGSVSQNSVSARQPNQTKQGINPQCSQYQFPYSNSSVNPRQAGPMQQGQNTLNVLPHQTQTFQGATQYSQKNPGGALYQGYAQQCQGNANQTQQQDPQSQGFIQQQQHPNFMQQQYNIGNGYGSGSSQVNIGPAQCNLGPQPHNMGYGSPNTTTNMSYMESGTNTMTQFCNNMGPTNIWNGPNNMGPGPNNMGPGPNNMGPAPNNMGPAPNNIGPGPSNMGPGPNNMEAGPNYMRPGPNNMVAGPNNMGPGPNNMGPGPNNMGPGPNNMGPGPNNMGPGPNNMGPGPNNMGRGPNNMGQGPTNMGQGPTNAGPGPNNIGSGSNNTGPGPINMGPGFNNMGPAPISMGPGPNNMGPGPNNMGPGPYNMGPNNMGYGSTNSMVPFANNMGPAAYNMGHAPCNMGPRPNPAMRQQPPVPGIDSEGRVDYYTALSNAAASYANYNFHAYVCYSQMYYTTPFVWLPEEFQTSTTASMRDTINPNLSNAAGSSPKASEKCGTNSQKRIGKDELKIGGSFAGVEVGFTGGAGSAEKDTKQVEGLETEHQPESDLKETKVSDSMISVSELESVNLQEPTSDLSSAGKSSNVGKSPTAVARMPTQLPSPDCKLGSEKHADKCKITSQENCGEPARQAVAVPLVNSPGNSGSSESRAYDPPWSECYHIEQAKINADVEDAMVEDAVMANSPSSSQNSTERKSACGVVGDLELASGETSSKKVADTVGCGLEDETCSPNSQDKTHIGQQNENDRSQSTDPASFSLCPCGVESGVMMSFLDTREQQEKPCPSPAASVQMESSSSVGKSAGDIGDKTSPLVCAESKGEVSEINTGGSKADQYNSCKEDSVVCAQSKNTDEITEERTVLKSRGSLCYRPHGVERGVMDTFLEKEGQEVYRHPAKLTGSPPVKKGVEMPTYPKSKSTVEEMLTDTDSDDSQSFKYPAKSEHFRIVTLNKNLNTNMRHLPRESGNASRLVCKPKVISSLTHTPRTENFSSPPAAATVSERVSKQASLPSQSAKQEGLNTVAHSSGKADTCSKDAQSPGSFTEINSESDSQTPGSRISKPIKQVVTFVPTQDLIGPRALPFLSSPYQGAQYRTISNQNPIKSSHKEVAGSLRSQTTRVRNNTQSERVPDVQIAPKHGETGEHSFADIQSYIKKPGDSHDIDRFSSSPNRITVSVSRSLKAQSLPAEEKIDLASKRKQLTRSDGNPYGCKVIPAHLLDDFNLEKPDRLTCRGHDVTTDTSQGSTSSGGGSSEDHKSSKRLKTVSSTSSRGTDSKSSTLTTKQDFSGRSFQEGKIVSLELPLTYPEGMIGAVSKIEPPQEFLSLSGGYTCSEEVIPSKIHDKSCRQCGHHPKLVDKSLASNPLRKRSLALDSLNSSCQMRSLAGSLDHKADHKLASQSNPGVDPGSEPRPQPRSADWPSGGSPRKRPKSLAVSEGCHIRMQDSLVDVHYPKAQGTAGGQDSKPHHQQLSSTLPCLSTDSSDTKPSATGGDPPRVRRVPWPSLEQLKRLGMQRRELSVDKQEGVGLPEGQPRGAFGSMRGIVVPDELLLITCQPDELEALCSALLRKSSRDGSRHWRMPLASEIVVKLDRVRCCAPANSLLSDQAYSVLKILSRYRGLGIVYLLPCKQVEGAVTIQKQINYIHKLRISMPNAQQCHCVWLTDVTLSSSDMGLFKGRNIDVCNLETLLDKFTPNEYMQQLQDGKNHQPGFGSDPEASAEEEESLDDPPQDSQWVAPGREVRKFRRE